MDLKKEKTVDSLIVNWKRTEVQIPLSAATKMKSKGC
jgi:hypothetical protein